MSQRQVLQVFEQYQNARTRFVQMVAEQATRPQNIETLQNAEFAKASPEFLKLLPSSGGCKQEPLHQAYKEFNPYWQTK